MGDKESNTQLVSSLTVLTGT